MFNKLKSFSEDVAKSINEIQKGDPIKRNGDQIERLKNSQGLLSQKTPAVSDLTQPTDEDSAGVEPSASQNQISLENSDMSWKSASPAVENGGSSVKSGMEPASTANPASLQDSKASSPDPLRDINLDELPPVVRSKLKKFVKYEEKYPVLLEAYKTEKRKGELIASFEKVMSEVTPVSSIADVGLLVDYLKGLTEKATLSSNELRKSLSDASKLAREKDDLAKKLADAQKTVRYAEESVGQKSRAEEEYKLKIKVLEDQIELLKTEIGSDSEPKNAISSGTEDGAEIETLKKEIQEKLRLITDLEKELESTKKSSQEAIEKAKETFSNELNAARSEFEAKFTEYEQKLAGHDDEKTQMAKLREEIKSAEESIEAYEAKIAALETSAESALELRSKIDVLTGELEAVKRSLQTAEESSKSSLLEIKSLKSTVSALETERNALQKELENRNRDAKASDEKIQTLESQARSNSDQIESLENAVHTKSEEIQQFKSQLEVAEKKLIDAQNAQVESATTENPKQGARPATANGKKKKNKKGNSGFTQASRDDNNGQSVKLQEELTKEKAYLQSQLDSALAEKSELVKKIENLETQLEEKSNAFESSQKEIKEKESELEKLRIDIKGKQKLVDESETQGEALQNLKKELSSAKREIEAKNEDLENLRDSLRDIGDELVIVKDSLKDSKQKWVSEHEAKLEELQKTESALRNSIKEKDEVYKNTLDDKDEEIKKVMSECEKSVKEKEIQITNLTTELENSQATLYSTKSQLAELNAAATRNETQLAKAKKDLQNLIAEKGKLNERIDELSKFKSADSALKLEVASLQASISHKDEQIKDLKDTLESKNKERDELKNSNSALKVTNTDLHATNQRWNDERTKLMEKRDAAMERANALASEVTNLQVSRQKIVTELDAMKLKHEALQKTRASASDELSEYKQQHDELGMKAKEAQNKIDDLQDELSEAKNMLQERTRESSTLRKMLLEAEEEHTVRCNELRNEIRGIDEEKSEVEATFQASMKKRQREIEELKSLCERYVNKISELETTCEEVRQRYEPLKNSRHELSSEDIQKQRDMENTVDELRSSLQASSKKVKDYENLNGILKKLNEESTLKFERLSKNYKHMTQQYRQMKESQDKSGSAAALERFQAESQKAPEANVAYLKNVLVGFLEHKEQREQLLPVLKMLFQLDSEDEKKLLSALR
ncbi:hypothetical protein OXX80_001124 [Metschnikowia pulcherrima]